LITLSLIESVIDQRRSVDLNQVNTVKTRKQHRTKRRQTQRRTKRRLTQRRTKRRQNNKKTQKKKLDLCDNHLFILKEQKKKLQVHFPSFGTQRFNHHSPSKYLIILLLIENIPFLSTRVNGPPVARFT
jgi:hypothetical protein